jgi:hypothetical protein
MNLSPEQIQGYYLLSVAGGFILYVLAGAIPPSGAGISRMGYFVRAGALALGSTIAIMLATATLRTFAPFAPPSLQVVTTLAIGLASGAYAGLMALGRSVDSGGRRAFAVFGLIPFANLWLAFAAPIPDPARPPYMPKSAFLRFLVGFLCLFIGSAASGGLSAWMETGQGSTALLEREIASINASLPRKLDEITTLVAVRHYGSEKKLVYENSIVLSDGAVIDSDILKRNNVPVLCSDQGVLSLLKSGYLLEYRYDLVDGGLAGGLAGGFTVSRSDCP